MRSDGVAVGLKGAFGAFQATLMFEEHPTKNPQWRRRHQLATTASFDGEKRV